ncbi:MAG: hypothetical protein LBT00_06000 [Spirochaetaceae bacterium]|jgi:hypothetical protein|nr:hypothetical protein [Spirochaetaceae bacterium]
MTNKKLLAGMSAMVLAFVFGLVLAGCASAPTNPGGGGGSANGTVQAAAVNAAAAEQLAADINAIKPGSAEVSGSTVTIVGGFVEIRNGLTVPESVTLEVTAGGSALGLRDSLLTVNGTVNAGSTHIRLEDNASWATINGSGTINLTSKGRLLSVDGNENVVARKLTVDGVTLVGLPDNDQPVVEIGNGGAFILKSGAITGNTVNSEGAGGGGVGVWEGGLFTMQGGAISGNSANGSRASEGGGVTVNKGTFTMEGGEISGNTSKGGQFALGGGVFVGSESVFTMKGGTISGNSAISNEKTIGGGVSVNDGGATFIMEGGTIYGSSAEGGNANTVSKNGAVFEVWGTAKWGTGGTYTKGGASQSGGSDIGTTSDTLIAVPAK